MRKTVNRMPVFKEPDLSTNPKFLDSQEVEHDLMYCLDLHQRTDIHRMSDLDMDLATDNPNAMLDFFTQVQNTNKMCRVPEEEVKEEPLSEEDFRAQAKDRQKKDNHNMIERRRRYNINDRIKDLGTLLPKQSETHYEVVRDVRQNKGSILRASVEYIKLLKEEQKNINNLKRLINIQKCNSRKLVMKIQEYEERMKSYGIPIDNFESQVKSTLLHHINQEKSVARFVNLDDLSDDDDVPMSRTDPMLSSPNLPKCSPYSSSSMASSSCSRSSSVETVESITAPVGLVGPTL